MRALCLPAP